MAVTFGIRYWEWVETREYLGEDYDQDAAATPGFILLKVS